MIGEDPLLKQKRRFSKATSFVRDFRPPSFNKLLSASMAESLGTAAETRAIVAKKISPEATRVKVLIISEATEQELEGNPQRLIVHTFLDTSLFEAVPTYHKPGEEGSIDINKPETFPPQTFEVVIGRNLICTCLPETKNTCGGIDLNSIEEKVKVLNNVAAKLNLANRKARAYLTVPELTTFPLDMDKLWSEAIETFNKESTQYIALKIIYQVNSFFGIKIKPRLQH